MQKFLFISFFFLQVFQARASRVYVNIAATGANNGTSWADAYTDLQVAIDFAYYNYKDTVWVARGTYKNNVDPSFFPMENVKVFGGFTGSETLFAERDWRNNLTILTSNNAHVIWLNFRGATNACIMDGFTITGGGGQTNTNGGGMYLLHDSPLFRNCTFTGNKAKNKGGGVWCQEGSPVFINCVFSGNEATGGGGIGIFESNVTLINCVITGNMSTTAAGGGAIHATTASNLGSLTMVNCTVAGNKTPGLGGAARLNTFLCTISNSIFYGNQGYDNGTFYTTNNATTITNCIVQGGFPGAGNMDLDPQFVNAPAPSTIPFSTGDYRLKACSPAITAGDNSKLTVLIDKDDLPRIVNSTVDIGAYEYQSLPEGNSLPSTNTNISRYLYPGTTLLTVPNTCGAIASVLPNGSGTALSGNIAARSWVDGSVQSWNGQPYVQRHYDITPAVDAATATARVTLYFTQAEFDAFNLTGTNKLPTGPADEQGIANLRVWQFHGTSTSGTPGTYSGAQETIDPANTDIVWNSARNYWQVSFNVTGFSGFAITAEATTLPLVLTSFNGRLQPDNSVLLTWTTAGEFNTDHFEIWRSYDGSSYEPIGKVKAAGSGNNGYSYTDNGAQEKNYYRLLMRDIDGRFTRSQIIQIRKPKTDQSTILYPNPSIDLVSISIGSNNLLHTKAVLTNMQGQPIRWVSIEHNTEAFSVAGLPPGLYLLKLQNGEAIRLIKQ
ncbi:MAG: T9SS type A sorting domain-containing protein [Chitinophagaceae bacterium]|nr:T9SS type A sorting domain-containing protein [Chitinophagaceae bacterium]